MSSFSNGDTPKSPKSPVAGRSPSSGRRAVSREGVTSSQNARRSPGRIQENVSRQPKAIVCYVCGRGFGTASYERHVPLCMKKRDAEQATLDPSLRTPLGPPPDMDAPTADSSSEYFDEFNSMATKQFNEGSLAPCPNCGRTFMPDRLVVHLRSCNHGSRAKPMMTAEKPAAFVRNPFGGGGGGGGGGLGGGLPGSGGNKSVAPKSIVCYICGKQFGTSSYGIHVPQCIKKREAEQANFEPFLRTRLATPPDLPVPTAHDPPEAFEEYNNVAFDVYNRMSLIACAGCHRTFLPDRLVVHMRSCAKLADSGPVGPPTKGRTLSGGNGAFGGSSPMRPGTGGGFGGGGFKAAAPRAIICYVCGRSFGTASFAIHVPQCLKQREYDQAKLTDPVLRTPAPDPPDLPVPGKDSSSEDFDEYNDAAMDVYNRASLVACPHCRRTFLPERLMVHLRSCKAAPSSPTSTSASTSMSMSNSAASFGSSGFGSMGSATYGKSSSPKAVVCYVCGRSFGTASHAIHVPQCLKQREYDQAKLDPILRTPPPDPPPIDVPSRDSVPEDFEAYNDAAFEAYNRVSLLPCPTCGRTFLPDRLLVHLRGCKPPRDILDEVREGGALS